MGGHADRPDDHMPVFVISVAAELSGLHPQTLRQYDRLGLVSPGRAAGRGRRYSARDIAVLASVQQLTAEGINLAGVKRILELEQSVAALREEIRELEARLAAGADSSASSVSSASAAGLEGDRAGEAGGGPVAAATSATDSAMGHHPTYLPVPVTRHSTAVVVWRRRRYVRAAG